MKWNEERLTEAIEELSERQEWVDLYADEDIEVFARQMLDGARVADWSTDELAARIADQIRRKNWTRVKTDREVAERFEKFQEVYDHPLS